MGTAQRDEYSVNAEHFASHLVSKRLGKARSFFHSFVLNVLERCFLFCFVCLFFLKSVSSFSYNFDVSH